MLLFQFFFSSYKKTYKMLHYSHRVVSHSGQALCGVIYSPVRWSETSGTAISCSPTAPPRGLEGEAEGSEWAVEGGLVQTYSLSSFLLLILPSEQDERGGAQGVCFFQWGTTFLLLLWQNRRGEHGGKDRRKRCQMRKGQNAAGMDQMETRA